MRYYGGGDDQKALSVLQGHFQGHFRAILGATLRAIELSECGDPYASVSAPASGCP